MCFTNMKNEKKFLARSMLTFYFFLIKFTELSGTKFLNYAVISMATMRLLKFNLCRNVPDFIDFAARKGH